MAGKAEERLLHHLLVCCQDHNWLKAGGKQRTDSTHVLARIRAMNRLECVGETMRFTLNCLATLLPDWLARHLQPEWAARYSPRAEEYRLPHTKPHRENYLLRPSSSALPTTWKLVLVVNALPLGWAIRFI